MSLDKEGFFDAVQQGKSSFEGQTAVAKSQAARIKAREQESRRKIALGNAFALAVAENRDLFQALVEYVAAREELAAAEESALAAKERSKGLSRCDGKDSSTCSSCGAHISGGNAFCPQCGAPVEGRQCPQCGRTYPNDSAFCTECGESLVAVASNDDLDKAEDRSTDIVSACPDCGFEISPAMKFCGHCGKSIEAGR